MSTSALTDALEETLAVFEGHTDGEPLTTSEVADRLEMGRRSTYDRLDRLAEREYIETKEVGARGRVWWLPRDPAGGDASEVGEHDPGSGNAGDGRERVAADSTGAMGDTARSFEALVDAVEEYAIFHLDPDGVVTTWNAGAESIKGYERDEIVGRSFETFYTDDDLAEAVPQNNLEAAAREGWIEDEGWRVRKDGSRFWASVTITALYDEGDLAGYAKVTRDMTERRTFEERLRQQRDDLESELDEVFERVDDAFLALDQEFDVSYVNDSATELLETTVGDAVGAPVWDLLPDLADEQHRSRIEETAARGESLEFVCYCDLLDHWIEVRTYPSASGLSIYLRDVTERRQREQELERHEAIVETVDEGIYVTSNGEFTMVNDEYAEMTGYDREELLGAPVSMVADEATIERAREYERELVEGDRDSARFEADLVRADGERIRAEATFAVLPDEATPNGDGAESPTERVGVVRDVTERVERERKLQRRRERLEALDDLNAVVRQITTDAIEQSTRAEMEETVCEGLAASDSYQFAWIGDVDVGSQTVSLRTEAGVEGYLDGVTISVDPDDPHSQGPAGQAFLTESVQTSRDAQAESRFEPWEDVLDSHGFRSSAAVPIVHEESMYGVLNVYTDRPSAFEGEERDVIEQLGTVLGHAIAALERKRALMSDEVVELEFRLSDVSSKLELGGPDRGHFALDRTVSIGDSQFLLFGTADDPGVELLEALVATLPHWDGVDVFDDHGDERRVQIRLTESPVLAPIASRGGIVEEFHIEDDDMHFRVQMAPGGEVREIIDVIQDRYPAAKMLSRRQIGRPDHGSARFDRTVEGTLTERQQAALEAAHAMGYFERPRRNSGQEIAETLDVTPATFHQHLRKAERKLIDAALDGSME
ncbi:putative PAS/PAC sensor protein [Salinarchaeum sp. Harcht-Bsk1]|uniref:PAS domain S-box protein n=1 Tax=Salinarchaeum sp. Harcht-Bsk1 TaxID=1333523 RepID=UPI000342449A|nr:PAS domain S-box protein [Salinarchaeum sp. Harcht-Bsk1]AGN02259.1 putative PAS/PAC sensor protein [Salinarchaeum sp. Harcht-Bsk1]